MEMLFMFLSIKLQSGFTFSENGNLLIGIDTEEWNSVIYLEEIFYGKFTGIISSMQLY